MMIEADGAISYAAANWCLLLMVVVVVARVLTPPRESDFVDHLERLDDMMKEKCVRWVAWRQVNLIRG